ncbi:MAG: hypothetical protein WAX07_08745 [Candidatus Altiarchaeia archaeon]
MKKTRIVSKKRRFNPRIQFYEADHFLHGSWDRPVFDDAAYSLAQKLAETAYPDHADRFERRWKCFYLPLKRSGRRISVPFTLVEYDGRFYLLFRNLGGIALEKGRDTFDGFYAKMLREALRFMRLGEKEGSGTILSTVPYDIRTGRVKGRYVLRKNMREKTKANILDLYAAHERKYLSVQSVSINEYLETAALCYRAAYGRKAQNMSPADMYRKWADGRDGGMLSIGEKNSRDEYVRWLEHGAHIGSHPFEIVFSWRHHGIHLYPPLKDRPRFVLKVTNYAYAQEYAKMLSALIESNIAFDACDYRSVLDYLSGDSWINVNDAGLDSFQYIPSKEYKDRYFRHIEWEELPMPKYRNK